VVSRFIDLALRGEPLKIYGDGLQTRTFCYIDDNLDTIHEILYKDIAINEVINIGSDVELAVLDLASIVINRLNSKSSIVHLPPLKEGDMSRRLPDIVRMRSILRRDLTPLEIGICKTAEHLQRVGK